MNELVIFYKSSVLSAASLRPTFHNLGWAAAGNAGHTMCEGHLLVSVVPAQHRHRHKTLTRHAMVQHVVCLSDD